MDEVEISKVSTQTDHFSLYKKEIRKINFLFNHHLKIDKGGGLLTCLKNEYARLKEVIVGGKTSTKAYDDLEVNNWKIGLLTSNLETLMDRVEQELNNMKKENEKLSSVLTSLGCMSVESRKHLLLCREKLKGLMCRIDDSKLTSDESLINKIDEELVRDIKELDRAISEALDERQDASQLLDKLVKSGLSQDTKNDCDETTRRHVMENVSLNDFGQEKQKTETNTCTAESTFKQNSELKEETQLSQGKELLTELKDLKLELSDKEAQLDEKMKLLDTMERDLASVEAEKIKLINTLDKNSIKLVKAEMEISEIENELIAVQDVLHFNANSIPLAVKQLVKILSRQNSLRRTPKKNNPAEPRNMTADITDEHSDVSIRKSKEYYTGLENMNRELEKLLSEKEQKIASLKAELQVIQHERPKNVVRSNICRAFNNQNLRKNRDMETQCKLVPIIVVEKLTKAQLRRYLEETRKLLKGTSSNQTSEENSPSSSKEEVHHKSTSEKRFSQLHIIQESVLDYTSGSEHLSSAPVPSDSASVFSSSSVGDCDVNSESSASVEGERPSLCYRTENRPKLNSSGQAINTSNVKPVQSSSSLCSLAYSTNSFKSLSPRSSTSDSSDFTFPEQAPVQRRQEPCTTTGQSPNNKNLHTPSHSSNTSHYSSAVKRSLSLDDKTGLFSISRLDLKTPTSGKSDNFRQMNLLNRSTFNLGGPASYSSMLSTYTTNTIHKDSQEGNSLLSTLKDRGVLKRRRLYQQDKSLLVCTPVEPKKRSLSPHSIVRRQLKAKRSSKP